MSIVQKQEALCIYHWQQRRLCLSAFLVRAASVASDTTVKRLSLSETKSESREAINGM